MVLVYGAQSGVQSTFSFRGVVLSVSTTLYVFMGSKEVDFQRSRGTEKDPIVVPIKKEFKDMGVEGNIHNVLSELLNILGVDHTREHKVNFNGRNMRPDFHITGTDTVIEVKTHKGDMFKGMAQCQAYDSAGYDPVLLSGNIWNGYAKMHIERVGCPLIYFEPSSLEVVSKIELDFHIVHVPPEEGLEWLPKRDVIVKSRSFIPEEDEEDGSENNELGDGVGIGHELEMEFDLKHPDGRTTKLDPSKSEREDFWKLPYVQSYLDSKKEGEGLSVNFDSVLEEMDD